MTPEDRFTQALRSPEPTQSLRDVVLELAREGESKSAIYERLLAFVPIRRTQEDYRDADEDALTDVMDALTGWCHPSAELLPDQK
jgi:hypothetical protein